MRGIVETGVVVLGIIVGVIGVRRAIGIHGHRGEIEECAFALKLIDIHIAVRGIFHLGDHLGLRDGCGGHRLGCRGVELGQACGYGFSQIAHLAVELAGAIGMTGKHILVRDDALGSGGDVAPLAEPGAEFDRRVPLRRGDFVALAVVTLEFDAEERFVEAAHAGSVRPAGHQPLARCCGGASAALENQPATADREVLAGVAPFVGSHVVLLDRNGDFERGRLFGFARQWSAVRVLGVVDDDALHRALPEGSGDGLRAPFVGRVDAWCCWHGGWFWVWKCARSAVGEVAFLIEGPW